MSSNLNITDISLYRAMADELNAHPETFTVLGEADMVLALVMRRDALDGGDYAVRVQKALKPGGIVLHVEQPQYAEGMPLFEQAMRDWDAFYNNEPFWSTLHEIDLDACMVAAGFERDRLIHDGVTAVVDRDIFPDAADDETEDYGRKAAWHVIGARK